ncbi:protein-L-isoaspartate O-methyltransferase [Tilletiaria anomala UBC 951]|uniref:protein-L-isoaspartate(D-aspartate) O-methyltransferase n=1 Tax=Tilletiaria anomala (strain ATCC 24038 / CBS 436.72 / UBC 951) TaxID=1037660 RepID=A0A066W6L0_TILAU|nr:protein-L-isoaspartate O-methyltransferase [Tilletiaria anomala UBC 951]KDN48188.1 protein-L-isoaspartate O-methyltransferase [Tilletiaria anomala UBC 951]
MAWRSTGATNAELVANMQSAGLIKSSCVAQAFAQTDRAHYVKEHSRAYEDAPSSIGYSATISAPHMHAYAAESLQSSIRQGKAVLDIGSGSGYTAAIFHRMLEREGGHGKVVGIEHIRELVEQSKRNLKADGLAPQLEQGHIQMVCGDGRLGWPEDAPYGAIHVGAAAPNITEALVQQLDKGGKMFIPVSEDAVLGRGDQYIWEVEKDEQGVVRKRKVMGVMYVPLTDAERQRSLYTI